MRFTTIAAALLVVLAGSGVAGAATLTLTYVLTGPSTIYLTPDDPGTIDIENRPTKATYAIYGTVTNNSYNVTGGSPAPITFYGGVQKFEVNVATSSTLGQVTPTPNLVIDPSGVTPAITFNSSNFLVSTAPPLVYGTIVDAGNTAATENGTGGIIGNGMDRQSVFGTMASSTSATAWRAANMTATQLAYWQGNTAGPHAGANQPVLLFSGEFEAVKVGDVTVNVNFTTTTSNTKVWGANLSTGALTLVTPTKVGTSFGLTVGADTVVSTNEPPTQPVVNPTEILETSWSKEGGWNNLLHSVDVTAASTDDGKPIPPGTLTYLWKVSKPGVVDPLVLGETGAALHLTLDMIKSLGLPAYAGVDSPSYHWNISVTSFDGELSSGTTTIPMFVPEPATMGLLAFGVFGLLKRRRA